MVFFSFRCVLIIFNFIATDDSRLLMKLFVLLIHTTSTRQHMHKNTHMHSTGTSTTVAVVQRYLASDREPVFVESAAPLVEWSVYRRMDARYTVPNTQRPFRSCWQASFIHPLHDDYPSLSLPSSPSGTHQHQCVRKTSIRFLE